MTLIKFDRTWINPAQVTTVSTYPADKAGWGIAIQLSHGEVCLGYYDTYEKALQRLESVVAELQAALAGQG